MVGHYLLTLTQDEEDRVLTERLARAPFFIREDGCRCLVGVAADIAGDPLGFGHFRNRDALERGMRAGIAWVGGRFDKLCERFGEARINDAIRNRILSNRAYRALHGVRECVESL